MRKKYKQEAFGPIADRTPEVHTAYQHSKGRGTPCLKRQPETISEKHASQRFLLSGTLYLKYTFIQLAMHYTCNIRNFN